MCSLKRVVDGSVAGLGSTTARLFNTLVTNVQGPRMPLYLASAKLEPTQIQIMRTSWMSRVIAVMT